MMFLCNEGGLSNSCHGGSISLLQLFELPSEIDGALIWVGEGGHQSFFKINLANLHLFRDAMSDVHFGIVINHTRWHRPKIIQILDMWRFS